MITNQNIFTDVPKLLMYATDASAYRELPHAISCPGSVDEIRNLIRFARSNRISIIPRGAGTSLAGQVVGNGLVIDISRHLNRIIEVNQDEKWVRVEPGVVLDELNIYLEKFNLFFAPETSTSNRCTIGGMVGNNSSGLHSLIYGTTRDHLVALKCILSDGSETEFTTISKTEFENKLNLNTLEGKIYRQIYELLRKNENRKLIKEEYPDPDVVRRNTGYALDELVDADVFNSNSNKKFNFCKLLAGSEGTLAFITEIKLSLLDIQPGVKALVCAHFNSVSEAIRGNLIALKYNPGAVELMDNKILELTRKNPTQARNRFFVKDDPGAILIIEFVRNSLEEIHKLRDSMVKEYENEGIGYYFPVVAGEDIRKVWDLRKAGLGVLSNLPGDAKPVSVIEDTSVNPVSLENYIQDFNQLLEKYKLDCVYHAHISVGELHLRPILDLKNKHDIKLFREIARDTAELVKKYRGSLSGEHGDGRLRGEFIPLMLGDRIYSWLKDIKNTWDPEGIFNPGKITDTPPMNTFLRYEPGIITPEIPTIFDFSEEGGIVRAAEKCNGSGDCRKSSLIGGTMCPSYMATREEYNTTRARANILREFLSKPGVKQPFNHHEIYDVLDLCLSCKACKSECPSNVDIAKMKAEFLQHYYDQNGISFRTRVIGNINLVNKTGSLVPSLFNFIISNPLISGIIKRIVGFARPRSLPSVSKVSFRKWLHIHLGELNSQVTNPAGEVVLFVDEFTNFNDTGTGVKAAKLLSALGYRIIVRRNCESGRSFISKGLLRAARKRAVENILLFKDLVSEERPLVGIEPSAILGFRDEYPDFFSGEMKEIARKLGVNSYTIEEFLAIEFEKGKIDRTKFTKEARSIKFHGHCQQKAVSSHQTSLKILSIPENYTVEEIRSGCCGMAGSFGFEKEHYDLSMKIGELVLFPQVRNAAEGTIIAASGTSCRHQIKDGTGQESFHPVEILYDALLAH